jgi:hypothetical protein
MICKYYSKFNEKNQMSYINKTQKKAPWHQHAKGLFLSESGFAGFEDLPD